MATTPTLRLTPLGRRVKPNYRLIIHGALSVAGKCLFPRDYPGFSSLGLRCEQLLFTVNEGGRVEARDLEAVSVRNCVRWTSFDTITAEYTPAVIDVIYRGVALSATDPQFVCVFSSFYVDALRRTGGRAKET